MDIGEIGVEAGRRAVARCDVLGTPPYSEDAGVLIRPFLTASHARALDLLADWMKQAGMTTRLDPIGNLISRYEGAGPNAPALLIGSHIDSVHDAGRYDGILGIMLGIETVSALNDAGRRLPFAIEVIAFGDEEGSRFPASMVCSRALGHGVDPASLALADERGVTLSQALTDFGLDPAKADQARRKPGDILAYLETHIEQGPVLEAEGLAVGTVTAIAAQLRMRATFKGMAGHAGTTPMRLRQDALAGAAEAILAVEKIATDGAKDGESDLVGTVGRIVPLTGAFNVIVGGCEIGIDLRAGDREVRNAAAVKVCAELEAIAMRRGLTVEIAQVQDLSGCPCDPHLSDLLGVSLQGLGLPDYRLLSGAGHDAMVLGDLAPVCMLFIRTPGGISHNAAESVDPADAGIAAAAMIAFAEALAKEQAA